MAYQEGLPGGEVNKKLCWSAQIKPRRCEFLLDVCRSVLKGSAMDPHYGSAQPPRCAWMALNAHLPGQRNGELHLSLTRQTVKFISLRPGCSPCNGNKGQYQQSSAKALFEARKGSGLTSIGTKHSWGLTQLDLQPKKEEWKHKQEMPVPFQYKKPSFMQLKQNFLKSASLEMTTLFCYLRTIGSVRIYKAMHVKTLFPH